jgi:hypothetical protein
VVNRSNIQDIAQSIIQEKLGTIKDELQDMYDKNQEVEKMLSEQYKCENTKVLEVVLEHILFHWDDIMELLLDELLEDEALELNQIENQKREGKRADNPGRIERDTKLADKSLHGKYHDYRSVDMRDILGIFEEYKQIETSIKNRL